MFMCDNESSKGSEKENPRPSQKIPFTQPTFSELEKDGNSDSDGSKSSTSSSPNTATRACAQMLQNNQKQPDDTTTRSETDINFTEDAIETLNVKRHNPGPSNTMNNSVGERRLKLARLNRTEDVEHDFRTIREVSFETALTYGFSCKKAIVVTYNPDPNKQHKHTRLGTLSQTARYLPKWNKITIPCYTIGKPLVQMFLLSGDADISQIRFENSGQVSHFELGIVGEFDDRTIFWVNN